MNFGLSDDQAAIQRTARDFLADRYKIEEIRRLAFDDERGFTDEQWRAVVELGWSGLPIAEQDGGQGLGIVELAIVQEELGRALAPLPLHSTLAASLVLAASSDSDQRGRWLTPLARGEQIGTVALYDRSPQRSPFDAELQVHGSSLTATKTLVADAHAADVIVIAGRKGRAYVAGAADAGVTITPLESLDRTRRLADVHFHGVEVEQIEAPAEAVERAYHQAATALAAESVGVAQRALEMAVAYAKERKQFGTPIGAYQAVSHACAQMLLETEGARSTTLYAAWTLDHDPSNAALAVAVAKAYASDAAWRVAARALQVHGGIGFTWEHDLHLWLKRAKANAHAWGDARWQRGRVAELAGV
jgi:alkylation response protein AidB-like acyl-CoA dehydrogenase